MTGSPLCLRAGSCGSRLPAVAGVLSVPDELEGYLSCPAGLPIAGNTLISLPIENDGLFLVYPAKSHCRIR
jgi:hypothetical protein